MKERNRTAGAILSRARHVLQKQGPRALLFKAVGEFCYRRVNVYRDDFRVPLDLQAAKIPLEVRLLEETEIDRYGEVAPESRAVETAERLAAGHLCHAAWHNGRIAGYVWSAPGRSPIDYLGVDIEVPQGAVYGYEILVAEDVRRLGVSVGLIRERRAALLAAGFDTEYAVVMPENAPALRFQASVKRPRIGSIHVAWLGSRRKSWMRMAEQAGAPPFRVLC